METSQPIMKATEQDKAAKTLTKGVTARVFISPTDDCGGNPVTIFHLSAPTTSDDLAKLAQKCPWESIIIEDNYSSEDDIGKLLPIFHFYVPSGEEVSFCGHAAIGACSYLANKQSIIVCGNDLQPLSSSTTTVSFLTAGDRIRYDALVTKNEVQLIMHQQHTESECNNKSFTLVDFLSALGLDMSDVLSENANDWPLFLNSSVARPKTLIPISSIQRLHAATPPRNADKFRDMCDSIESTGVYLYSPVPTTGIGTATTKKKMNIEFECRQFPRWSGYPEDPATGIAAGALAASLHKRQMMHSRCGSGESCYICYQGTAMGRPSKIQVAIGDYASSSSVCPTLKVTYTGFVVFDTVSF